MKQRLITCTWLSLAALASASASTSAWASVDGGYPYQSCFEIAADLHKVPLDVLLAVAATESNWDPDARSHANAHGIMQIQWPGTARHLGVNRVSELYNPCLNIDLGARYLRELLNRNQGDLERALAAYNYGPTRIEKATQLPAGAARYVATVDRHRTKINGKPSAQTARAQTLAARGVMRFDHRTRAEKFVAVMNRQISSADFSSARSEDGSFAVTMTVAGEGLSPSDVRRLRTLGWPGLEQP